MCIDGIKTRITDNDLIEQLLFNPLLEWNKNENIRTEKVITRIAKYNGLVFSFYKWGTIEIVGSLHKYFNKGIHNADDFTMSKLQAAIATIKVAPSDGYYWDNKHGNTIAFIKMLAGAAIGKTLDDSVNRTLKV